MGTHLLRLALLLAALQYAAMRVAPSGLPMDELLKNGGRIMLKSTWNKQYLTGETEAGGSDVSVKDGPPGAANHFTVVQISDTKIALRAANGKFLRHYTGRTIDLKYPAQAWEHWIPVNNGDGSWSFTNEWNKWLSPNKKTYVEAADKNSKCEKWHVETWELGPVMKQLMENGGRHFIKVAFTNKYLAGQVDPKSYGVTSIGQKEDISHWTFVQTSETEVALRASNGKFFGHRSPMSLMDTVDWYENWTPVPNGDGRWGFRSRKGNWLSARDKEGPLSVEWEKQGCELFWLEPWQPSDTLMDEVLANGGRHLLKAYDGRYLEAPDTFCGSCVGNEVFATPGPASAKHHWTIIQMNDKEIAFRSPNGRFMRHNDGVHRSFWSDWIDLANSVNAWEMWKPVKNADGTWSFKNRFEKGWLTAQHIYIDGLWGRLSTQRYNSDREHFGLENW